MLLVILVSLACQGDATVHEGDGLGKYATLIERLRDAPTEAEQNEVTRLLAADSAVEGTYQDKGLPAVENGVELAPDDELVSARKRFKAEGPPSEPPCAWITARAHAVEALAQESGSLFSEFEVVDVCMRPPEQ